MKSTFLILFAAIIVTACSHTSKAVNIQDLNSQFISAWNNKDSAKVISFLADDVQFLQANTHFKGKAEVTQKWVKESLPAISNLKTSVASSGATDSIAYEGGTFSVDVSAPNQPPAFGEGNYILLWKKGNDGAWKLSYAQLEDLPLQIKGQ